MIEFQMIKTSQGLHPVRDVSLGRDVSLFCSLHPVRDVSLGRMDTPLQSLHPVKDASHYLGMRNKQLITKSRRDDTLLTVDGAKRNLRTGLSSLPSPAGTTLQCVIPAGLFQVIYFSSLNQVLKKK
jgi:hypothetical protein